MLSVMNTTTSVVGGIIIIVLAVAVFMLATREPNTAVINATSTPQSVLPGEQPGSAVQDTEDVVGNAPVARTSETVAPSDTTVVVTGTVDPNYGSTDYWYEYGVGTSMGKQSAKQTVGAGDVVTVAPAYITGLAKSTTYYYRLVAENQYGKSTGEQNTFRTSGTATPVSGAVPTAKTIPANEITKSSASLRGEVNPNKGMTQYWFEYGRTNRLGNTTAFISLGNGSASIVATAAPTLNPNTTYFFRVNAQNEFGTVNGTIMSFKTAK